ncbi:MAG: 1,4-dihydroxy-2-naphthoate octaprenyltransferase [Flavobacteriales bacterium]|nr:1,4-dihydroxy-2-naphthoate octaprenyltransferase [Flavobacteriales bacterium]MCX7768697.1 1,4-dihydroxy-2-naphthoate octaprenyltransferase [Flavobacteriales bacterium]MDW8410104.1 1,4-dihydroxy-2-naphthoate octaprenyltransferase [Flavobacteriales bacterium]
MCFRGWLRALRLRTLPLSICAVATGGLDALGRDVIRNPVFLGVVVVAIMLQALSNLANDYGDFVKGVDSEGRVGPPRALQKGLLTPSALKKGIVALSVACLGTGIILLLYTFHDAPGLVAVFTMLGILAIGAAVFYTLGRRPFGYRALGEVVAFLFFGPVAVCGTYFLLRREVLLANFLHAVGIGFWVASVLLANNIRDISHDATHGKCTLAVALGLAQSQRLLSVLLALGAAGFVVEGAWPLTLTAFFSVIPLIVFIWLIPPVRYDIVLRLVVLLIILNTVVKALLLE